MSPLRNLSNFEHSYVLNAPIYYPAFPSPRIMLVLTKIHCRAVFVSFGGLLLYLEGPYKKLAPLRIDYIYLLLKK